MAVIKFPCSICQKPMAVGPELAGSQVRCPHCLQVLIAPAAAELNESGSNNPFQFGENAESREAVVDPPTLVDPFRYHPPGPEAPAISPASAVDDNKNFVAAETTPTAPSFSGSRDTSAGGRSTWILAILVPYALFMTFVALYYFVKYSNAAQETPLDQIPDLLGEFQQKQTKAAPQSRMVPLPPPDQNLPAKLLTTLGNPVRIGAIEVTPLTVQFRPWTVFTKVKNRTEPRKTPIKATLVMQVRLKNISPDLTFYPTDPYFDRNPKQANDKPYSLLDIGGRKYYGGVIEYATEPGNTERTWLAGQENDDKPLNPGESRETVLVARPADGLFDAAQKAKQPAVWRMQVRRGLVPYRGTEVPVSTVVGVAFTAADVQKPG
jgi:hypothetical protein